MFVYMLQGYPQLLEVIMGQRTVLFLTCNPSYAVMAVINFVTKAFDMADLSLIRYIDSYM